MKNFKFSKRTDWPHGSNPLSEKLEELREKGVPLLDLTVSNPTVCGFRYLKTELLDALKDPAALIYEPDARGLAKARAAVQRYYAQKGIAVTPEQIFLTANTSEAYSFVFKLLADAGDTLLVPQPSYPLLDYLAGLNDIQIAPYPLSFKDSWRIRDSLENSHLPKTRAIVVVNPNNPTGNFVQGSEKAALRKFCKSHGCALIADEVFFDYALSPQKTESFAGEKETLTFTLSGISKILGLPQMKLSWIIVSGPKDLLAEALHRLEIISDTYLSAGTPVQHALPVWLGKYETMRDEILERVKKNYDLLRQKTPALRADGGWYAILEMPETKSDEEWAIALAKKFHVITHPGYLFESEYGHYLVVSLLTEPEKLKEGIVRISRAIAGTV